MGCGSSNHNGNVVTPDANDETKTNQERPDSKALPKPTLMKADKFLSREEARERRHRVLEEKQIRSQNNAQAISAQAMVDQERLSTSTRRSVRSFASNSTATPLRATEPSTEEFAVSERVPEKGPGGTKNIQITSDKEIGHQAPEVIVEESKSVISSEDKEGKLDLVVRDKELVETDKVGVDEGGGQSANITLSKEKKMKEGINSELGSKVNEREEEEEGRSVEVRTMANLNTDDSESLESDKQSAEPHSEIIESQDNRRVHAGDTVEDNSEVKTNSMAETDKQGIGQRSNHETEGEVSENQAAPGHQDVDEGTIMDNDIGERIVVKGEQREGVQEEVWDGSDEGVADLGDGEEEMENGVHGGAN
ncbi:hypothetical protein BSL78_17467 [Apostichopus japonicus]|uniref:Uncharacterized protein n=1 Tax=Stichopus japonicus TaxID=307972 RepID=A0A2G8KCF8_STIJA|nr:hypothetical protein BSL78_17467 [Apostichopus japonicus]